MSTGVYEPCEDYKKCKYGTEERSTLACSFYIDKAYFKPKDIKVKKR